MRDRLVLTFASVAAGILVVAWVTTKASDSALLYLLVGLALIGFAAGVGVVAAARLSRLHRSLVRRDQAVAIKASHELRTPVTALRLSLEDLTLWKDTPPAVADELNRSIGELDRLAEAVTELLDQHRDDHLDCASAIDVSALTVDLVTGWQAALDPARDVDVVPSESARAIVDPAPVRQILTVVLDQFTDETHGDVTVEVMNLGRTIRVRAFDSGRQRFTPGVIHGAPTAKGSTEELTLAEAGALAAALGGYLAVEDRPSTCLSLILPAARRAK
jgi:signal transduction histidine kinase